MSNEIRNRAEGRATELGGKLEKAAGKVLGNEAMAESGQARESNGRAQAEAGKSNVGRVNAAEIKPGMPVVCSNGGQFAVVDHMEGQHSIKVKKDDVGQHHFFPLSWVTKVDSKVHVDRPGAQARKDWGTEATP
jgi:uncharacterized protein YjbJ (UPF0337 family)